MDKPRVIGRLGALAVLALLLGGCGFQLRGDAAWPATLQPLHVGGPELRLDFARVLRPALRAAGATLATAPGGVARLEILGLDEERHLLSAAAGSELREYELRLVITYRVVPTTGEAGEARRIAARRDYLHRPTAVTGALTEERRLRDALLDEVAAALVRRLALAG